MTVNKIKIDAIKSRVAHASATNQDCADLMTYIDENIVPEKLTENLQAVVEEAIEGCIDQDRICRAVERAIENLKK